MNTKERMEFYTFLKENKNKANIDFSIRAEKLDIEQILRLSDVYFEFYSQEK